MTTVALGQVRHTSLVNADAMSTTQQLLSAETVSLEETSCVPDGGWDKQREVGM